MFLQTLHHFPLCELYQLCLRRIKRPAACLHAAVAAFVVQQAGGRCVVQAQSTRKRYPHYTTTSSCKHVRSIVGVPLAGTLLAINSPLLAINSPLLAINSPLLAINSPLLTCINAIERAAQTGDAEVAEAVDANVVGDLLVAAPGGDQFLLLRDVDAKVAGVAQGRRAGTQVNFFDARVAQSGYQPFHGVAAHDGVIDNDEARPLNSGPDEIEFQVDLKLAQTLVWFDEAAVAVAVLDNGMAVGDAGSGGVAQGRRDGRVGYGNHCIGLDGMLAGQFAAQRLTHAVDITPVELTGGVVKINVVQDA